MKLLVTGGAGFIGSNFIHYWIKNHAADQIINLDKLTYAGNLENLKAIENNSNYIFVKGDITDRKLVNKLTQGIDYIVHFAAESHVDRSIMDPREFVNTNIVGTFALLEAARAAGVKRFHHISSDEVFGQLELNTQEKFTENTPYNPRSPYAASKAASDHLVKSYFHTYSLPITITNCGNNFGPFMFPEKLIPLAITNLLEGKKVPVYGDGKNVRDWIYVADHCRAIDFVLKKGIAGQTYCVGGMTNDISNLEVVKKIISNLKMSNDLIEFVKDRKGHDRRYALDWKKIKLELGWQPLHDFEYYLAQTVKWYQENTRWWKNVKNQDYRGYYNKQYQHR